MKIAQGKRGTSAALGEWQDKSLSLCPGLASPSGAPNQDKGRLGSGVVYPGRQSLRSFALGCYLAAPSGRRRGIQRPPVRTSVESDLSPKNQVELHSPQHSVGGQVIAGIDGLAVHESRIRVIERA
jgi:hypothetical protein